MVKTLASIDIQTLEMDADACAIQDLFREYMQQIDTNNYVPKQLANERSMSYCLLFCHILAMAVTSYYFMTIEKLESSEHPTPFMRHMIALSTLSTNYLFNKPTEHENLMNVAVRVYKDFVKSHKRVIEDDNFEELEWTFAPDSVPYNYAVVIGKHWDNLRPKLEKYAMVTLPPMYNE